MTAIIRKEDPPKKLVAAGYANEKYSETVTAVLGYPDKDKTAKVIITSTPNKSKDKED